MRLTSRRGRCKIERNLKGLYIERKPRLDALTNGKEAIEMRMPAIFVGHGDPMLALRRDDQTRAMRSLGAGVLQRYGKPKGILCFSAHWFTRGSYVQTAAEPHQIYDMVGFPDELYQVKYPAKGNRVLSERVLSTPGLKVKANDDWGIDHGAWTVLVHMFPEADIPVVQYSIDGTAEARAILDTGRRLAYLRDAGYLILGSGNVVHNLRRVDWQNPVGTPAADTFDNAVKAALLAGDIQQAVDYSSLPYAEEAVPTPDHYLPLLAVTGAAEGEKPTVFNDARTLGMISMTGYAFGLDH